MPQASIPYAVARVKMLSQQAFDQNKMDRLLAANSYREAQKLLNEMGWGGIQSEDEEKISAQYLSKAYELIKKITPAEEITDCFLIKYDIHNIKTLIKARELKQKVDFLSANGIISLPLLEHAITERVYKKIDQPDLVQALEKIEQLIAIEFDPFMVDVTLDQTMYKIIFSKLNVKKKKTAVDQYFITKVDLLNATMLLRVSAMNKDFSFFNQAYIPYGSFEKQVWESFFAEPDKMAAAITDQYGAKLGKGIREAAKDTSFLPALEKKTEDYLIAYFSPYKKDPDAIEAFLGYLLGVEREVAAVRLVMAAKANGFSQESVSERMRELYG